MARVLAFKACSVVGIHRAAGTGSSGFKFQTTPQTQELFNQMPGDLSTQQLSVGASVAGSPQLCAGTVVDAVQLDPGGAARSCAKKGSTLFQTRL